MILMQKKPDIIKIANLIWVQGRQYDARFYF